uniref:uncharacterized protein LOC122597481 n=1 Tax=Erigeron canadensis TaxID=72917 RepID=UPI001CB9D78B|nr:uncharacterized protein LOC122597481 [Erigeron canadensis]
MLNKKGNQEEAATSGASEKKNSKRKSTKKDVPKSRKKSKPSEDVVSEAFVGTNDRVIKEEEFIAEPPKHGAGKSPMAMRKFKESQSGGVQEIDDSGDDGSNTGEDEVGQSDHDGLQHEHIPEAPKSKRPLKMVFPHIPSDSYLSKDIEKEEFIDRAAPPARLQEIAMLSIREFRSSTNETTLRHLTEQHDFWRRYELLEAENEGLKEKNKEYRRKLRNFESQNSALQTQKEAEFGSQNCSFAKPSGAGGVGSESLSRQN